MASGPRHLLQVARTLPVQLRGRLKSCQWLCGIGPSLTSKQHPFKWNTAWRRFPEEQPRMASPRHSELTKRWKDLRAQSISNSHQKQARAMPYSNTLNNQSHKAIWWSRPLQEHPLKNQRVEMRRIMVISPRLAVLRDHPWLGQVTRKKQLCLLKKLMKIVKSVKIIIKMALCQSFKKNQKLLHEINKTQNRLTILWILSILKVRALRPTSTQTPKPEKKTTKQEIVHLMTQPKRIQQMVQRITWISRTNLHQKEHLLMTKE